MATRPLQTITLKNEGGEDITYTLSGEYPDLTAGSAEQIISDEYTENKVPYLLRASNFGSRRENDTLVGGTVAWNQLANAGETTNITSNAFPKGTSIVSGHKYLVSAKRDINTERVQLYLYKRENSTNQSQMLVDAVTGSSLNIGSVIESTITFTTTTSNPNNNGSMWVYRTNSSPNTTVTNFQFIDLTQMFGSTIADYIYSLEQATTGAGVAWFKALFPNAYYAYNAGELMSVSGVSAHKMVGFNAFDKGDIVHGHFVNGNDISAANADYAHSNYIPIVGGMTYYYPMKHVGIASVVWYDSAKNMLGKATNGNMLYVMPQEARYARINMLETEVNTACINLSSSRNGEYEPYKAMSYPLDSSLTLRGVPKLDANNSLYYDGDTYEADGTVTRKYGIVDLGSLTWTYYANNKRFVHSLSGGKPTGTGYGGNGICSGYETTTGLYGTMPDKSISVGSNFLSDSTCAIVVHDEAYTDAATFKTAMNGVYMVYELATPTTETADPFTNPQTVDPDGTEEYVSTGIVPVGHDTKYFADLVERLAAIPEPPTVNGTYRLIATVTGGVATLSWTNN